MIPRNVLKQRQSSSLHTHLQHQCPTPFRLQPHLERTAAQEQERRAHVRRARSSAEGGLHGDHLHVGAACHRRQRPGAAVGSEDGAPFRQVRARAARQEAGGHGRGHCRQGRAGVRRRQGGWHARPRRYRHRRGVAVDALC
ncbi:hypothetical protein PVAP13_7NG089927 [Panicum virgatum]|uniref:Uncharacterized protein n=1 Tax=Panicum virgatum TaxID=38727 RepID=A0A8T0PRT9_PANVG|nr:hypothetical protein PVAP13_7NG089927 [Panicum virgatum]